MRSGWIGLIGLTAVVSGSVLVGMGVYWGLIGTAFGCMTLVMSHVTAYDEGYDEGGR